MNYFKHQLLQNNVVRFVTYNRMTPQNLTLSDHQAEHSCAKVWVKSEFDNQLYNIQTVDVLSYIFSESSKLRPSASAITDATKLTDRPYALVRELLMDKWKITTIK